MRVGAVILAAGMSTRMVQFKQLMKIGNRTMAERIVVNFQRAGVTDIVMVTGYRSEQLEKELDGFGITFLKNENYKTTEMFDSAKIGLKYLEKRCDKVFFCPVDIPFFMEKTVTVMLEQTGDVILPVYKEKSGHPVLICSYLIPEILNYSGECGLKGALNSIKDLKRVYVTVNDEAVLMDADTKEDFQRLIDLHNSRLMHPEIQVKLVNHKPFFERQTVMLLQKIDTLGSVREACESIGISYSKGWSIIHLLEDGTGCRVVERQPGGKHGGVAMITARGKKLIELFENYEAKTSQAAEKIFEEVFAEYIEKQE